MQTNQAQNLIDELGLGGLSPDKKENLINEWEETLQNRLYVAVMSRLNDGEKDELDRMSGLENNDDQIMVYIKEHVSDLDVLSQQVYEDFKKEIKSYNNKISTALKETDVAQTSEQKSNTERIAEADSSSSSWGMPNKQQSVDQEQQHDNQPQQNWQVPPDHNWGDSSQSQEQQEQPQEDQPQDQQWS